MKLDIYQIKMPLSRKVTRTYQSRKAFDLAWDRFKNSWAYRQCYEITGFQLNSDNTWTQIDILPQKEEA